MAVSDGTTMLELVGELSKDWVPFEIKPHVEVQVEESVLYDDLPW